MVNNGSASFVQSEQPPAMVLIPAGSSQMGDSFSEGFSDSEISDLDPGFGSEVPVHPVTLSAFYIDKDLVTKALWDKVANWAAANGYDIKAIDAQGKWQDHPVYYVAWYDAVKWANARSEMEGLTPAYYADSNHSTVHRRGDVNLTNDDVSWSANGYRLPTEAEWEKAARGGEAGHRFPWDNTDTIQHARANYQSTSDLYSYDTSPTRGFHPDYDHHPLPFTSPAGIFAPNRYGLYDMAGNVWQWVWDWYDPSYYSKSPGTDPRGPVSGSHRVIRGGSWLCYAIFCRVAFRAGSPPGDLGLKRPAHAVEDKKRGLGFRLVRTAP